MKNIVCLLIYLSIFLAVSNAEAARAFLIGHKVEGAYRHCIYRGPGNARIVRTIRAINRCPMNIEV